MRETIFLKIREFVCYMEQARGEHRKDKAEEPGKGMNSPVGTFFMISLPLFFFSLNSIVYIFKCLGGLYFLLKPLKRLLYVSELIRSQTEAGCMDSGVCMQREAKAK